MLSFSFSLPTAWPSEGAGAKAPAFGGNPGVGFSPSFIPFSVFSSSSSLRWKLASSVSLSPSHHRTDRRVGQVKLARDVSGRVLLQEWTETERREGGGVWRGRHKRESRLGEKLRLAFLSLSFSLNHSPGVCWVFKQPRSETPRASASFVQKCRSTQVCSARPVSGRTTLFV